jgi:LysR family transcriptional regulator for metE and metH
MLGIGMECHPSYQWLLKVVQPFLARWAKVGVGLKPQFQILAWRRGSSERR